MNNNTQKICKELLLSFPEREQKFFLQLTTPAKVQDYLNTIPQNFEYKGETCHSPLSVVKYKTAHCMEGALLSTYILALHGIDSKLVHLQATRPDDDHVITIFKQGKYLGALSKTNHGVLRYREPIYRSLRELIMSYFHEYFLPNGQKTLYAYSVGMSPFIKGYSWITSINDLWVLDHALDTVRHINVINKNELKQCRKADTLEIQMGTLTQWKKKNNTHRIQ